MMCKLFPGAVQQASNTLATPHTTLKNQLLHCWEFSESSGSILYDLHGTGNGSVYYASLQNSGLINNSYHFDGTFAYVDLGTLSIDCTQSFTIAAWIKPDDYITSQWVYNHILSNNSAYQYDYVALRIYPRYNKDMGQFYIRDISGNMKMTRITQFSDYIGQWVLLVGTFNPISSVSQILYNNAIVGETNSLTYSGSTKNNFYVAWCPNAAGGDKKFKGFIDQIAMWQRVLSSDEIQALYNAGNGLAYNNW